MCQIEGICNGFRDYHRSVTFVSSLSLGQRGVGCRTVSPASRLWIVLSKRPELHLPLPYLWLYL
jgi:hypothetical protein